MALTENLENCFKPETRKSGSDIFNKDVVSISSGSDTQIQAYVRGATSFKVSFSSPSISSSEFTANCTCTTAQKDQLCKHMWATLLKVADKYPDFLESKSNIVKAPNGGASSSASTAKSAYVKPPPSEAFRARAEEMKAKQAEYRKAQYQKQKERLKEQKTGKKSGSPVKSYPEEVESAFKFFSDNGFELKGSLNEEELINARKKLARIFHPDKGGSHDEAMTLNENFSILEDYLGSES